MSRARRAQQNFAAHFNETYTMSHNIYYVKFLRGIIV